MLSAPGRCQPAAWLEPARLAAAGLLLALAATACSKPHSGTQFFKQLAASDFGLGVTLGQTAQQVEAVLGAPDGSKDLQNGVLKEEYWVARDPAADPGAAPPAPGAYDPQLTLTFVDGKLAQLYSAYHVEDPAALIPPRIAEPITGVKIGAHRNNMLTALGKPALGGKMQDEWRWNSDEGTAIGIKALYVHVDAANADLVTALTLSFYAHATEQRGEQFEKDKKANEAMHGKWAQARAAAQQPGRTANARRASAKMQTGLPVV